jgi:hypothetical protein
MPTGAKLAGSLLFFAVAYMAAMQAKLTLPEGTPASYFNITIAAIGFWQGWMVMGARAGGGMSLAMSNGLRTSLQIAFFAISLFALRTMFIRSANLRYDNPGEAVTATLELFLEYLIQTLTPGVWGVLLIGGIVAGILTEFAARAWR